MLFYVIQVGTNYVSNILLLPTKLIHLKQILGCSPIFWSGELKKLDSNL